MSLHKMFFMVFLLLLSLPSVSQRRITGDEYNRLGLQAGITYGGIKSNSIPTVDKTGFMAGFTTRANTFENFIIIYGVNFYQFNQGVMLLAPGNQVSEEIEFKTTGVQLNLFGGMKILGEHLSIHGGPVLQLNGKWKPETRYENYTVEGYDLVAGDLENISPVNFNLAGNLSTGFRSFKLWFQYQYGISNVLRRLNTAELQQKDSRAANLKGKMGFATAGMVFFF